MLRKFVIVPSPRFVLALDWEENLHPRGQPGNAGEFAPAGGSKKSTVKQPAAKTPSRNSKAGQTARVAAPPKISKQAHLVAASPDRTKWPSHIQAIKVPPAWTDVKISSDPKAALLVIGKDAKGRDQYVYSEAHKNKKASEKFKRIQKLNAQYDRVNSQNQKDLRSKDPKTREHAAVTALVMDMGLRPGSETDTGAKEQAYGATTLEASHVVKEGDQTYLRFIGKKGVRINLVVDNSDLARDLNDRAKRGKQLFPDVNERTLRTYVAGLGSGGFRTKDLRTLKGTSLATLTVEAMPVPKNANDYKKAVQEVAKKVSVKLGNQPKVALESYIAPEVFANWRASANA